MAPSTPNAEEKTERSIWGRSESAGEPGRCPRVRAPYLAGLQAQARGRPGAAPTSQRPRALVGAPVPFAGPLRLRPVGAGAGRGEAELGPCGGAPATSGVALRRPVRRPSPGPRPRLDLTLQRFPQQPAPQQPLPPARTAEMPGHSTCGGRSV